MIHISSNKVLERSSKKSIILDYFLNKGFQHQPLVIFCHGYKGYKDWGAWSLMAETFAMSGIAFVKFNFSHNGGTMAQPIDFPDLDAFGHNNYSKELDDLGAVIDWAIARFKDDIKVNISRLCLMGHSRGGGIAVLKAAEDSRVKQVISLAGVSDFKSRFPVGSAFDLWKKTGVYYVKNGRTLQNMPHYFQFYEDFMTNEKRLTISKAARSLNCPYLIIHGTTDKTVQPEEAERLHGWCPRSHLLWLNDCNHVFGMQQPWQLSQMPQDMKGLVHACLNFLIT